MMHEQSWASIGMEQQQARLAQLSTDERQCRSYLTLARETVEMFHYLTVIMFWKNCHCSFYCKKIHFRMISKSPSCETSWSTV